MSQRELRVLTAGVELREANGQPQFFGKPIVFGEWSHTLYDSFRERFVTGCLDAWLATKPDLIACMHHDTSRILGRASAGTLRFSVDAQGLSIDGDLPNTTYGRDLAESIKRKDIRGMSFMFRAAKDRWTRSERDNEPNLREVLEAELYEVCFVTDPAYPQTTAGVRSREDYNRLLPPRRPLSVERAKLALLEMQ